MQITRRRAIISQEFLDMYVDVAKEKFNKIKSELASVRDADLYLKSMLHVLTNLEQIIGQDERAMDLIRIRMHGMGYSQYGTDQHRDTDYFWGLTEEIICRPRSGRNCYDMGRYMVYVPRDVFLGWGGQTHVVPMRDVTAHGSRHPHNYASRGDTENPLDAHVRSCYGSFGPYMSAAITDCDILEYFALFHRYLSRWTPGDTLVRPNRIRFAREAKV